MLERKARRKREGAKDLRRCPSFSRSILQAKQEAVEELRFNAFHAVRTSGELWARQAIYLREPGYGWPVSYGIVEHV